MSTTESIASSQTSLSSWRKSDTTWTLGLFGTAIGAGVLFFPIRAGFGGLIPILVMLVLAYPIAFYCHRALARLCLSGANPSGNITETVEEHFGKTGGVVITFLYFFAICPLLWIYGVTITNTFMTFWENQLQMPALNRGVVALLLLLLMAFVIWFGKDLMVKVMSYLVWPFIASLVVISLSLIPYWNSAVIDQVNLSDIALTGHDGILVTVWLGISIMVFSFNFSPIVSSFVVSKREEYEAQFGREYTERKCSQIISRASMLMVAVVMFFAFSCLFYPLTAEHGGRQGAEYPGALLSGEPLCLDVGHQIHLCHPAGVWRVDHRPGGHLQIVFRPLSRHARRAERSDPALWL
ncbi:L-threonine transporter, anaerobically inducible [Klebsiella pneumoniae]|nr:L-threonine transporter, anaerobically inducible [Klebsiella pneumoniae]